MRLIRFLGCVGACLVSGLGTMSLSAQSVRETYEVFPMTVVADRQGVQSREPMQQQQPDRRVTLSVRDSTVKYVINEVARQARLRPVYSNTPLLDKRISVTLSNATAMNAIATVLKGTGMAAKIAPDGETVMIRVVSKTDDNRQDGGGVQGTVVDSATGKPLIGATVSVQGTKIAALTTDKGQFLLRDVPAGAHMVTIRLFGYKPVSYPVTVPDTGRVSIRVIMVPIPTMISRMVTTAVGEQRKLEVGSDITVINADSVLRVAPVSNVTQLLEGRVPGLIVQHTTGTPGAPTRLRLRGMSSVKNSNDPILIVDGVRVYSDQSGSVVGANTLANGGTQSGGGQDVKSRLSNSNSDGQPFTRYASPSPIDQIDPNSIETIQVMKGPSASSLYGADAANGVIVITTKRGRAGPTHWNTSFDLGRKKLTGNWPTTYYRFGSAVGQNNNGSNQCSPYEVAVCALDSIVTFQALNDARFSPFSTGGNQQGSMTVSGGNGALTYSVTGSASSEDGYLQLPGIVAQDFALRHGFSAPDWMIHPDKYRTWGGNSRLDIQLGKTDARIALTNGILQSNAQRSSLQSSLPALASTYISTSDLSRQTIIREYYERAQLKTLTSTNAITLDNWRPIRWLPISATGGLNVSSSDNNSVTPRNYITGADSIGEYFMSRGTIVVRTLDVRTNLQQRFVNTAVGLNVHTESQNRYDARTRGLQIGSMVPDRFQYDDNAGPSQFVTSTATYGWYLQPTLNFNSRFFVSPGFRFDGGSASGSSSEVSLFPKMDFSYIALNRSTDPLFGAITLFRPRVAFGIAGVQPGAGERLRLFQSANVIPIGSTVPTDILRFISLGNTELHPERSRELEGGFDLELWNQRTTLTLTGYDKMRYDAIMQITLPSSVVGQLGSNSIARNIGKIRNTGVEAALSTKVIDRTALRWDVNANMSRDYNHVVSLVPGQGPVIIPSGIGGYESRITPGFPVNSIWARPILSYADANGNGLIEPSEVRVGDSTAYLGQGGIPNYQLAFSTNLGLFNGRLNLNTAGTYQNGLTQVNRGNSGNLLRALNDPSTTITQQAAIAAQDRTAIGVIQTVNTLRWSTISLNYVVPASTAKLFRVTTMTIGIQGSNLALHTNYRGKDPNVSAFSKGDQTADAGGIPDPRAWSLRVTLGN